jgi:AcrR family transcriptional regulator
MSDPATGTQVEAPERRRGGRPRSVALNRAILEAALDLLPEVGYGGLTMEGVAARAGVGKTTVYRRWPSKVALLMDAWRDIAEQVEIPDTGEVRRDLLLYLQRVIEVATGTIPTRIIPAVAVEAADHPELAEAAREFWAARRALMFPILDRGIARGELRPDFDREVVADLLLGPIYYRLLVSRAPLKKELAGAIVSEVLEGAGAGDPRSGGS